MRQILQLTCTLLVLCNLYTYSFAQVSSGITGKFVPKDPNQRLLILGQSKEGLKLYIQTFGTEALFGATTYTSPATLGGIESSFGTGDVGTSDLSYILKKIPDSALVVGLYFGYDIDYDMYYHTTTNKMIRPEDLESSKNYSKVSVKPCITGVFVSTRRRGRSCGEQMRNNLKDIITTLKNTNKPVYLRIAYEAEGPWNGHSLEYYKFLWKFTVYEIRRQKASNIATVWHIAGHCSALGEQWAHNTADLNGLKVGPNSLRKFRYSSDPKLTFEPWYPGDDLVDWTGFSYFSQADDCQQRMGAVQSVIDYLKTKKKPIMIAEAAPRGWNLKDKTLTANPDDLGLFYLDENHQKLGDITGAVYTNNGRPVRDPALPTLAKYETSAAWERWYRPLFDLVDRNKDYIKAVAYINDEWETQSRWRCNPKKKRTGLFDASKNCAEGYWGNSNLASDAYVIKNWKKRVLENPTWIKGSPYSFSKLQGWCEISPSSPGCK